jgi:serine/threonine-protein kinase
MKPSDPLQDKLVLGRYRLLERLGKGGMGSVYKARQLSMDRLVAIKLIHPNLAEDPAISARFHREMQATSRVEHPNTVQVFDYGQAEDGQLFLVMELLQGRTLAQLLRSETWIPAARLIPIAAQIARALGAAHAQGIVHRDLKPENVMLVDHFGERDFVKVLDFGIARFLQAEAASSRMTADGALIGTPTYMSPEQARGEEVGPKSDLYSLGVLLYQVTMGLPPFEGTTLPEILLRQMKQAPRAPSELAPGRLSRAMEQLILSLLEKEPALRPADAEAVLGLLASASPLAPEPQGPERTAIRPDSTPPPPGGTAQSGQPAAGPGALEPEHTSMRIAGSKASAAPPGSHPTTKPPLPPSAAGAHAPTPSPALASPASGARQGPSPSTPRPSPGAPSPAQVWAPSPEPSLAPLTGSGPGPRPSVPPAPYVPAHEVSAPGPAPSTPAAPPGPKPPARSAWKVLAAIGAASLLFGLGAALWWARSNDSTERALLDRALGVDEEPPAPALCRTRGRKAVEALLRPAQLLAGASVDAKRAQDSEALQWLDAQSGALQTEAEYWALLARARLAVGTSPEQVRAAAAAAARLCPTWALAHNLEGKASQKAGLLPEAKAAYQRALDADPSYLAPRNNLGLIALLERNTGAAIAAFDEVLARRPGDFKALQARAEARRFAGQTDAAIADLQAAATVLEKLGRSDDAQEAYCRARSLGSAEAARACKKP